MHFTTLEIENLGVYRGRHQFDLRPGSINGGKPQNMVVIYGKNGAGKSTLYKFIKLALYGKSAFGDRVSLKQYDDIITRYLDSRITQEINDDKDGSISICFEYLQSGSPVNVKVRRSWRSVGGSIRENLEVSINGSAPEILGDGNNEKIIQGFIHDFIPFEVSDICFFDAEQWDNLVSPEAYDTALGQILRHVLGLDIVVQLYDDIQRYIDEYTRSQGGSREILSIRKEIFGLQEQLEKLRLDMDPIQRRQNKISEKKRTFESKLKLLERQLAAQGGAYAERREALQEQLRELEIKREHDRCALIELCNGLLPFAFAPELLNNLDNSLRKEAEQQRNRLAAEAFRKNKNVLLTEFKSDRFWKGTNSSSKLRKTVLYRLKETLDSFEHGGRKRKINIIHHITDIDRQRIIEWIYLAQTEAAQAAESLCNSIAKSSSRIAKLRTAINRAPDDAILAPLYAKISKDKNKLDVLINEEMESQKEIVSIQYRINEIEKCLHEKREKLIKSQSAEHNLDLANRSRLVLKTYEDALLRSKIDEIETAIARNFNALCHKTDLLTRVELDPSNSSVNLFAGNGRSIAFSELSAGERQLYIVSVLWALRQTSGKELPLFVDTPVAKLDEHHGWQLIHEYFPNVSKQVVLFAHTREMDKGLLAEASPYTASRYRLEYDDRQGQTSVIKEQITNSRIPQKRLISTARGK
jgi:DNA sulfur modification protein DndD